MASPANEASTHRRASSLSPRQAPDAAIPDEASKETVPGGPVEKQLIPARTISY